MSHLYRVSKGAVFAACVAPFLLGIALWSCSHATKTASLSSEEAKGRWLASATDSFAVGNDGSLVQTKDVGIHPDLEVPVVSEEDIRKIREKIQAMQNLAVKDVEPEVVGVPDYEVVKKTLRGEMTTALTGYLTALGEIDVEIRRFFSKLHGLQLAAESDKTGTLSALVGTEIARMTPEVNASINKKYATALAQLYLSAKRPVLMEPGTWRRYSDNVYNPSRSKSYRRYPRDQLRAHRQDVGNDCAGAAAGDSQLACSLKKTFGGCVTGACVMRIGQDLESWFAFVEQLNQEIDLDKFDKKTFARFSPRSTVPLVTLAILDAAGNLVSGPQLNKEYSVPAYLKEILEVPGGIALGIAAAPFYFIEKAARFTTKLAEMKIMKVGLKLSPIRAYAADDIGETLRNQVTGISRAIPAVIYGEEEIRRYKEKYDPEYQRQMKEKQAEAVRLKIEAERKQKEAMWEQVHGMSLRDAVTTIPASAILSEITMCQKNPGDKLPIQSSTSVHRSTWHHTLQIGKCGLFGAKISCDDIIYLRILKNGTVIKSNPYSSATDKGLNEFIESFQQMVKNGECD